METPAWLALALDDQRAVGLDVQVLELRALRFVRLGVGDCRRLRDSGQCRSHQPLAQAGEQAVAPAAAGVDQGHADDGGDRDHGHRGGSKGQGDGAPFGGRGQVSLR